MTELQATELVRAVQAMGFVLIVIAVILLVMMFTRPGGKG